MFVITGGQADSDVNFNTTANEIEFDEDHVFADGEAACWLQEWKHYAGRFIRKTLLGKSC